MGQVYHGIHFAGLQRGLLEKSHFIRPCSEPAHSTRKRGDLTKWISSNLQIESQLALKMMLC
jgi:hypothetical protein